MIKRILVALDADEDTPVATNYAIKLGMINNARLTGVAVVDTSQVAMDVAMAGVETAPFNSNLQDEMMLNAHKMANQLTSRFKVVARGSGLEADDLLIEGVPSDMVINEMKYHDLLVIGNESHFFFNRPKMETGTLDHIVKKGVCPVLVVGKEYHDINKAMLAFDGSAPSARAIQRFIQFQPYGRQITMEIVNVRSGDSENEKEKSRQLLDLMFEYARVNGYKKIDESSVAHSNAADGLMERLASGDADLIVMGAHSVSAIRRMTFGSTTHYMVKNSPVPLFLSN